MIYSTTETIPGREIAEIKGVVTGNVVQSKHIGRDFMAGLKSIVGGEIRGYTEMMTEARNIAIQRMVEDAANLGADAVVGIRFTTSSIVDGSSEILAFGTAVKLENYLIWFMLMKKTTLRCMVRFTTAMLKTRSLTTSTQRSSRIKRPRTRSVFESLCLA